MGMNGADLSENFEILLSSFRGFTVKPSVIGAAADTEHGTEQGGRINGRELFDQSIPLVGPSDRMLIAFFKISR